MQENYVLVRIAFSRHASKLMFEFPLVLNTAQDMAQPSLDDKRKQKEAGDYFMSGKNFFRIKDINAAVDAFTHAIMLRP